MALIDLLNFTRQRVLGSLEAQIDSYRKTEELPLVYDRQLAVMISKNAYVLMQRLN